MATRSSRLRSSRGVRIVVETAPPSKTTCGFTSTVMKVSAPSTDVRPPQSPTESVQPVATSDMLAGSVLDVAPLEGDDFQSLMPLLPGVVRGPDGRLRAKGGQA